jgi:uncharacterized protein YkwD
MSIFNCAFCHFVNRIGFAVVGFVLSSQVQAAAKPIESTFQDEILSAHNEERQFQGGAPLIWDAALAAEAAKWAENLATHGQFEHAYEELSKSGNGENLWMGTRGSYAYRDMVGIWLDEANNTKSGRFPDVSQTGDWTDVGHYVQIVWPETRKLGCAISSSEEDDYLVCRYWPGGNRIGDNFILRPRK